MPEELQGKQTEAVGSLSLYRGEAEEEVFRLINNNKNRDRKQ